MKIGIAFLIVFTMGCAQTTDRAVDNAQKAPAEVASLFVFLELKGAFDLGLIHTSTDQLIKVNLSSLAGWPRDPGTKTGDLQHAWITPNGKIIYLSLNANESKPAAVVVLRVKAVNWDNNSAELAIEKVLALDQPGMPTAFPNVVAKDSRQPIASWTQPARTQAHGPTFQPHSSLTYITQWTDSEIHVINVKTHQLLATMRFGDQSRQTHGVNFNPSGTLALGTGYYYDNNEIDVYRFNRETNRLEHKQAIKLGNDEKYAAFTHFTYWLDNRYALTATMQLGPTSLTPPSAEIIGPGVWLLDVPKGRAEMVIGAAASADDAGVFRSASDLVVAGNKLYVAEEDSIDGSFGDDGFVSVFDISNIRQPLFLKRLKPGGDKELPKGFYIAHGLNLTLDESFVYVVSYASSYIVKINTETDEVEKVYDSDDGITAPHGGFIVGRHR